MGSINGLKNIHATSIQNAGQFYLGNNLDSGAAGQVIISAGPQQAALWGSNSATLPGALTMGTNLSLASGNASFDGTTADTINGTGLSITGGNGISVVGGTSILTDNDNTTINNTGGTGQQNQVLKVPNALTINSTTYDGSVARNFTLATTDTTYTGTVPIAISAGPVGAISLDYDGDTLDLDGADLAVQKVPNVMTASTNIIFTNTDDGAAETSYDGSQPITIRATDTDTTYQGSSTINIDTSTNPDTINALKVPNVLTSGSNISMVVTADGSSAANYDGSQGITITGTDTDTTYQGGTNISIDTTTNPDTINLDANIGLSMINPVTIIAFQQFSGITALIGNAAANPTYGTDVTYLDLSDATNITSPYCFHNVYDSASTDFDSLTTSYAAGSILGALGASIVAKQTALCVEVIVYNYAISSNRDTDMRLVDKSGSEWSVGISEGGSGTGTIQTAREVHRADETDRQIVHQTWSITGLTIGSTYTFNPQARTSATSNFLAAGGNYPAAFFRGYYLPS